MKNLLKYLLFAIVALAMNHGVGENYACDEKISSFSSMQFETQQTGTSVSSKGADIFVPRQVSSVTSLRLQSNSRRAQNFNRHNLECIKAGKLVNSSLSYTVQKNTLISHSSHIETAYKLVSICRLII